MIVALTTCVVLLATGRPLNIHITHTHKVEEKQITESPPEKTEEQETNKDVAEFIQDFLGVLDEE